VKFAPYNPHKVPPDSGNSQEFAEKAKMTKSQNVNTQNTTTTKNNNTSSNPRLLCGAALHTAAAGVAT
jgi:hypothetical protein